jgi:NAD(P)-dependent dehydrogenase (short-subunit alcohol dehydrogenase family)
MRPLEGKRASVIGPGHAHAAALAAVLEAAGAEVATLAEANGSAEVDILVTCPSPATQVPGGTLHEVMADVARVERWTADAGRAMQSRGGGAIVHVTGLSGLGGWPGWEASGAAFAAIHSLVGSFAVRLAGAGVRVNALVPGVSAELGATIAAAEKMPLETVRARIPSGRFLDAEALGHALLYLVHDSASYVTGEILAVDGGWDIWGRLHAAAAQ